MLLLITIIIVIKLPLSVAWSTFRKISSISRLTTRITKLRFILCVYMEREREKKRKREGVRAIRVNVCISRFVAATFRKKKKKFPPPLRIQQFSSSLHVPDALLSAPRILYFFFLFFRVVNVTPSNDINVTRACHAFARLFENNRISGGRERERIPISFFCE